MDIKSTKAYGKMKVSGVGPEFDYSESGGIHTTVGQMMKDLFELKKSFKGEITIRLSPKPFTQLVESEDMIEAIQQLEVTLESDLSSVEAKFQELWDTDLTWQMALKLNHETHYNNSTIEQRKQYLANYNYRCSLTPGLKEAYPIHWVL